MPDQDRAARPALQYEQYTVRYLLAPWVPDLLDLAELQPGNRVLDLACGTGAVARVAAVRVGAGGAVVGLDLDTDMLEVARQVAPRGAGALHWRQGDAADLPFPDASFDAVLCQQGLQFFADRAAALGQARRVLVHGGRVALAVWNAIEGNPYSATLAETFGRYLGPAVAAKARMPFALGNAAALRDLLAQSGFRDVEVKAVSKPLHLPPLGQFIPEHLRAMSLAPVFASMNAAARSAMIGEIALALASCATAQGAALPFEVLMAVGR